MDQPTLCKHIEEIKDLVLPKEYVCKECVKIHRELEKTHSIAIPEYILELIN